MSVPLGKPALLDDAGHAAISEGPGTPDALEPQLVGRPEDATVADVLLVRLREVADIWQRLPAGLKREVLRPTVARARDGGDFSDARRVVRAALGARGLGTTARLGAPLSISDLTALTEPEVHDLVKGLIPADANVLLAGYPKTHKTNFVLALAVALGLGKPFLGRFQVARRSRVGCIWMEDREFRIRRRLIRLCQGYGVDLEALEGQLWQWFRPPLRLNNGAMIEELAAFAAEADLDVLWVDSYAYVADGDSNSADDVTPQLVALSSVRTARPGLTVGLTHHARKVNGEDTGGQRLTDRIRNSSAFGAWYDVGLLLGRRDETAPVTVRAELREAASPEPFAFAVEDEHAADFAAAAVANGWLKLEALVAKPLLLEHEDAARRLLPAVLQYVADHDGCSHRKIRSGVDGKSEAIDAALKLGEAEELLTCERSPGRGKRSHWHRIVAPGPTVPHPCPGHAVSDRAHRAPTPVGGGHGHRPDGTVDQGVSQNTVPSQPDADPVAALAPKVACKLERRLMEVARGQPDLDEEGILRTVPLPQRAAGARILQRLVRGGVVRCASPQ